ESRFFDPIDAGHVAVTIQVEGCRKHGIPVPFRSRKNRGNSGAYWSFSRNQFAFSLDQSYVTDGYAGYVGDGVVWTGLAGKWNSEISASWSNLRGERRCKHEADQDCNRYAHTIIPFRSDMSPAAFSHKKAQKAQKRFLPSKIFLSLL